MIQDTTKPAVGSYAFDCGLFSTLVGNTNQALCTHFFNINGCAITYVGQRDGNAAWALINPGTWTTGSDPSTKGCPKAADYTNLAYSTVQNTATTPNQVRCACGTQTRMRCLPARGFL